MFKYTSNSLSDLYKVNRIMSLNIDSLGDHIILYEALKDLNTELKGKIMFKPESFKELTGYTEDSIVIINDTDQIKNQELRNCLNNNGIKAFMLYPIEELVPIKGEKKVEARIMVCSDIPRKWSQHSNKNINSRR